MVSKNNFERCGHVMPSHRQNKADLPYFTIRSPMTLEASRTPEPRRKYAAACRASTVGKKVSYHSCHSHAGQGGVVLSRVPLRELHVDRSPALPVSRSITSVSHSAFPTSHHVDLRSSVYPPRPGFPEARSRILPPPALILMAK
jgi:hypothetical protein